MNESEMISLAWDLRADLGVSDNVGSLVGGVCSALAGAKAGATAGATAGAKAGLLLGPTGVKIGAVAGGVVGAIFAGSIGAGKGSYIATEIVKERYKAAGLCEAAIAVISTKGTLSVTYAIIRTDNFKTFKDKMKELYDKDQFQTKTLNDEIIHVQPATLAMKKSLPWFVADKIKADVFRKFSPIDENVTGLKEIEAVLIDFSVERIYYLEIHGKLEQGLYKGNNLFNKLCK